MATNGSVFKKCKTHHTLTAKQYLILGAFFTGIGSGCWYVAESGSIMSLAPNGARGKYLALWIVSRNLGQLVGGAIK
jgi:MFS family permease